LPTPEEIQIMESINWHVGGTNKEEAKEFIEWLEEKLIEIEDEYVEVHVVVAPIKVRLPKRYVDDPENNDDVNMQALVEMTINDNGIHVNAIQ